MKSIVLLIEKDPLLRSSLTTLLEIADYQVVSPQHNKAGMAAENRALLDLIFLDLDTPVQGDKDYLQTLKLKHPGVRLVLFAPVPYASLPFEPFSCGVDAYLEKPCDPQAILYSTHRYAGNVL